MRGRKGREYRINRTRPGNTTTQESHLGHVVVLGAYDLEELLGVGRRPVTDVVLAVAQRLLHLLRTRREQVLKITDTRSGGT
jgi:hypothetical protein